jgi:hypothetical protein
MSKTVFYSWQSDDRRTNTYIKSALDEAVGEIREETIVIDRDTQGERGAVSIADVIMRKISQSDIFLADISITGSVNERSIVNQNVLFELGYAVGKLDFDNIILVANRDLGPIETLPFDIRNRRIVSFSLKHEDQQALLAKTLTSILKDYVDKGISTELSTEKYAFPKIKPQDYNSYEARDVWVEELLNNLVSRDFSDSRIRLHRLNIPKPGLRLLINGHTEWAMNVNYGGMGQDDGISFTLGTGRDSNLYNNSHNGYGQFIWSAKKKSTVLEYHDFSFLNIGSLAGEHYTAKEFAEKLWTIIVKRVEEVLQ